MTTFDGIIFVVAVLAGIVASIAGFGIGSLLTPLIALKLDTKLAIILVSVPHFIGTLFRFLMLRQHIDKRVLLHFGILSAVGGLTGAYLNSIFHTDNITYIFTAILIFAGLTGATKLNEKIHFDSKTAWVAGVISGLLGGLIGNQGGIRSAALLGFKIESKTFVATATAIGIIVDIARIPVYFVTQGQKILEQSYLVLMVSAGVILGTFLGNKILKNISEVRFKQLVSGTLLLLGIVMLFKSVF